MKNKGIFYATEKDIFDALSSKKKKITKELLLDLCNQRGIILSEAEDREDIIEYLAMLPFSFNSLSEITSLIRTLSRAEKTTSSEIASPMTATEITRVVSALKRDREQNGEAYSVISESKDKTVVKISYSVIDLGMTRLRQRVDREDVIEFVNEAGTTKIRRPANEKMEEVTTAFVSEYRKQAGKPIAQETISLAGIQDSKLRTYFFVELVTKMPNLALSDVTHVRVSILGDHREISEDDESDNEEAEEVMIGYVKRAALDGVGLLYSEEYQDLSAKGFYISEIRWNAIEKKGEKNKIKFEASFADPEQCSVFLYNALGYYKNTDDGFAKTKLPLPLDQKNNMLKAIEESAKKAQAGCEKRIKETKRGKA